MLDKRFAYIYRGYLLGQLGWAKPLGTSDLQKALRIYLTGDKLAPYNKQERK